MAKNKFEKSPNLQVKINMAFEQAMKKAFNTPLPGKKK